MSETTPLKPARFSFRCTRGLFIDCAECKRGGNGSARPKCPTGGSVWMGWVGGCYEGELLGHLEVPK